MSAADAADSDVPSGEVRITTTGPGAPGGATTVQSAEEQETTWPATPPTVTALTPERAEPDTVTTVPPVPPRAPGDPPLDFVSYALLLVRAVMMRSSNGRTQRPQAEAAAAAPSPTRVRSVDVPSLLAEGFAGEREGEGRGRMSFDARSMSLVVPAESIDRYLAHGYDAMNIFSRG